MGNDTVVLTTEDEVKILLKKLLNFQNIVLYKWVIFQDIPFNNVLKKNIKKAYVVGFIGKLAKMAAGVKQTHVKGSKVDMNFLAEIAKKSNATDKVIEEIKKANTARHVSEIIQENKITGFFDLICSEVYRHMRNHSEEKVPIDVILV